MRRRLVRMVLLGVAVPLAARGAEMLADRLEGRGGPTVATRSLRGAARVASPDRHR